jgi:hypothetical protein
VTARAAWTRCCARSASSAASCATRDGSGAPSTRYGDWSTPRSARNGQPLFPDPSDDARFREATLDALPHDTARAVRELDSYEWKSPEAAQTFEQVKDLLRREVLDTQFRGMKEALENPDPEAMQRIKDMMADLNAMLAADERGEHTQEDFDEFMSKHGDMFPDNPANLEELVDSLARRAAAAERMMRSMSAQQRQELADLMAGALEDMDLAREMAQLNAALQARRPDLDRRSRERMTGDQPMGAGEGTSALQDLADLDELESTLGQDYPGASLEDVDEEAVRRALGRRAADDLRELRRMERELEEQGYLNRSGDRLDLTCQGGPPTRPDRRSGTSSPTCAPRAAADTTCRTRGRPASSPDRAARGSSATSSRWTSYAPSPTRCAPAGSGGRTTGPGGASPCRPRTSRWPRPTGVRRQRSACWWTCRTRWCCGTPGAQPRPRRWRCTPW